MANMGSISGSCTTDEALQKQLAIAFPNPGPSVEHPEGTANLFQQPCDGNPRALKNQGQLQSGVSSSSPSSASVVASTPFSRTSSTSVLDDNNHNTTSTTDTSSIGYYSTDDPPAPTSVSVLGSSIGPTPTSPSVTHPTQSAETCTEGHLTCLDDETHFATCTGGQLTPAQPIALGYKCRAGSGVGLDIYPA